MRRVVVFPAPFGPRKPVTEPGSTVKLSSETALTGPKDLLSPLTSSRTGPAGAVLPVAVLAVGMGTPRRRSWWLCPSKRTEPAFRQPRRRRRAVGGEWSAGVQREFTVRGSTRPSTSAPSPAIDDAHQGHPQARGIGEDADHERGQQEADAQQPVDDGESDPAPQARQFVGGVVDGRDERGHAEPREREAEERRGERREGEGQAHADGGQRTADAHDPALAEPVDEAVAGEPADRHGDRQGDEAQSGGGGARGELVAQVERAPGRTGVLDEGAAGGQHAEGRHGEQDREAAGDRRAAVCDLGGLLLAVAVVGSGEHGPLRREGHDGEDARDDAQVHRERDLEPRGRRAEEPAGDGADAPDAVEGVEDRAPVVPLHPQPVGVLGHVDDRVQRAGDEQRRGQREPGRGRGRGPHRGGEERQADGGDAGGAESADEDGRRQPGQQRTEGQGGERPPPAWRCSTRAVPSARGGGGRGSRRGRR